MTNYDQKRMNKYFCLILLCVLSGTFNSIQALSVGSKSSASSPAFTIFPAADSNNEMIGYARFEEGFALADKTTSCTFDNFMPISNVVLMNEGRLTLKEDLVFSNKLSFLSGGRFEGNDNSVEFSKHIEDLKLPLDTCYSYIVTDSVDIGPGSVVNDARSLDWSLGDSYLSMARRAVSGKELIVYSYSGNVLTEVADKEFGKEIASARWHPTNNWLALAADSGSGDEVFTYRFDTDGNTLTEIDSASLGLDATAVAWHPSGSYLLVGSNFNDSELVSYPVDGSGNLGVPIIENLGSNQNVNREALSFSPGGNQFAVGLTNNGTENVSELMVFDFSAADLTVSSSLDIGVNVQTVDWNPTGTYIAAGLSSSTQTLRVYKVIDGIVREAETARIGEIEQVFSVHWHPSGDYLIVGTQDKPSTNPEFILYHFDKVNETLTQVFVASSDDEIWSVRWSRDGTCFARGNRNTSIDHPHQIVVQCREKNLCPIIFKETVVVLNSDVIFLTPIQFIGACKLNARGKRVVFNSDSGLVIRDDSSLIIEDAELQNITQSSVRCLTDNGKITVRNSIFTLGSDYTFSRGCMLFEEDVLITGTNKFNYTTGLTSTIAKDSSLHIDAEITFSYAPRRALQDLIYMEDATADLHLNGCTLHSTRTGFHLAGGRLTIDDKVTMSSEAKHDTECLRLNANLDIRVQSGATIDLHGKICYD